MKRFSQRYSHSTMAELNVTPLLDLAFVLLIIFIITTPLLENQIPVNLPHGKSGDSLPPPDQKSIRTVSINSEGQIFLQDQAVSLDALTASLTTFRQSRPDAAVILRIDKETRYEEISSVLNAFKTARIERMNFDQITK